MRVLNKKLTVNYNFVLFLSSFLLLFLLHHNIHRFSSDIAEEENINLYELTLTIHQALYCSFLAARAAKESCMTWTGQVRIVNKSPR